MTLQAQRLLSASFLMPLMICAMLLLPLRYESRAEDASQPADLSTELKKLDLSQLMDIEVISVSKKLEKLSRAPAAIFVITQEDIRRSGATSLPELLRMVPGLQVARKGPNSWSISTRGMFGTREGTDMIDLRVDGCYVPASAMQAIDIVLDTIERIEVIRGPGSTVWGTKAVSGVINVISKHAKDTQGGLVTGSIGSGQEGFGGARYGVKLQEGMYLTAGAKYLQFGTVDSAVHLRDPQYKQGSFRLDWDLSTVDRLMFAGSYTKSLGGSFENWGVGDFRWPTQELYTTRADAEALHLMGRWEHIFSPTSDMALKMYYDQGHYTFNNQAEPVDPDDSHNRYRYYDIDFQHKFNLMSRNDIVWGAELRIEDDTLGGFPYISFEPKSRTEKYYSGFIQDEITIVENRLSLSVGSKFEYNSFCHFQTHPSARLLWTPHDRHTFWLAVSRTARTDLRGEHDLNLTVGTLPEPGQFHILRTGILKGRNYGSIDPEKLTSYEAGYRVQPASAFTLDITAFVNHYDQFLSGADRRVSVDWHPRYFITNWNYSNDMDAKSCGIEAVATWQAAPWWKLQSSYTHLHFNLHPGPHDATAEGLKKVNPKNQCTLRSLINITRDIELDTNLFFTDRISGNDLRSYTDLMVRLGWRPVKGLELSLVGANLLRSRHTELLTAGQKNEIKRSVLGKVTWTF